MTMPDNVNTTADLLMSLLQEVKEISLADAAKSLKVPVATVENWATFLEEEGMLQMKFKFTNPYLALPAAKQGQPSFPEKASEPEKMHVKNDAHAAAKDDLAPEPGEKLESAESMSIPLPEAKKMPAAKADAEEPGLFLGADKEIQTEQDVSSIIESLGVLKENLSGTRKAAVEDRLKYVYANIEKARTLSQQGRLDLAKRVFITVKDDIKRIAATIKSEEGLKKGPEPHSEPKLLLDKAYTLLKENKLEETQKVYEQLRKEYSRLPIDFAEKKLELEKNLVKLNKDLSMTMDRKSIELMREGTRKINTLIIKVKEALARNDFFGAEESYYAIKKQYESLPNAFVKERRELESQILSLFEAISLKRKELITKALNTKISHIESLIQAISVKVREGRIDEAIRDYSSAKAVYEEIPAVFVNERIYLQQRLMPICQGLSEAYSKKSIGEVQEIRNSIMSLISRMRSCVEDGKVKEAEEAYESVKAIFSKMPAGFVKEKIDIQNIIIEAYQSMVSKSEIHIRRLMEAKSADVEKMIAEATECIKAGKLGLSEDIYSHAVRAYNDLPQGFMVEKSRIRHKMLDLYKELTLNKDITFLRANKTDVYEKYRQILNALVESRHNVELGRFELLEPEYRRIIRIFNELPIGFIQENLKLREDVIFLAEEVDFIRKTEKAANGNSQDSKQVLDELSVLRKKLASRPESKQLIEHFDRVKSVQPVPDNDVQELHDKIEKLRAMGIPSVKMPV
ncbi:hypothetical protein HYU11_02005 [Candidatus Woesearchaeota archaeon]|nr:hypothetical protein [Candidatus Woesearchaeota archaeon]